MCISRIQPSGSQEDKKELDFYGVYHVTPEGRDRGDWSVEDAP